MQLTPQSHVPLTFALVLFTASVLQARCQTPAAPSPDQPEQTTQQPSPDDTAPLSPAADTPETRKEAAWGLLDTALDDKKHIDLRIQALAALGLMGDNPRSLQRILDSFNDPEVDIRTAAVLAAGQTKAPSVTTGLRRMLNDAQPQVAFAAASSLWKMNDRSGEDILVSVVDGERRASATLKDGTMHTMSRDLHHPSDIARMGAMSGASMLLGPFGFGITALEYVRKNGGDAARVLAVEEIAQNHTAPIRNTLLAALKDKDVAVRVSAAKALAGYHEPEVGPALADAFSDSKSPVRFTAAAAYLMSTGVVATPPALTAQPAPKTPRKTSHHPQ